MQGKLWEYCILYHPQPKIVAGVDVTEPSVLVQNPKFVMAQSEKQVSMIASREVPEQYLDKSEGIEIIVRPF